MLSTNEYHCTQATKENHTMWMMDDGKFFALNLFTPVKQANTSIVQKYPHSHDNTYEVCKCFWAIRGNNALILGVLGQSAINRSI